MVQAAAATIGASRVVVTGEAAMPTAQRAGAAPIGLNHPSAPENWRFVRQAVRGLVP